MIAWVRRSSSFLSEHLKSYFKFTKSTITTGGHFFPQKTTVFEGLYSTLLLTENFFPTKTHDINT